MEAPADALVTVRAGELQTSFTARQRPLEIWICSNVHSHLLEKRRGVSVTVDENAQIFGMWVDGNDLYLAGSSGPGLNRAAAYWKNGKLALLTDKTSACLSSVFVAKEHIYAAGFERGASGKTVIRCLKDGQATEWSDGQTDAYTEQGDNPVNRI